MSIRLQSAAGHSDDLLVELWNWKAERWEESDIGWGDNIIPTPVLYLHPDGVLRLKIIAGQRYVEVEDVVLVIKGQQ